MKVLVVDDSSTMRRIVITCLANMQLTDIVQANDGQEAVAAVQAGGIELVLMDWNMPNLTGIEALRLMRAQGHTMPIIMVTTEAEKERVLEALKSGANNYIIKPFRTEGVIEKINETLTRAGIKLDGEKERGMNPALAANAPLTKPLFNAFRELIYRSSGICLQEGKETLVQSRVQKRLRALNLDSIEAYLEVVKRDSKGEELVLLLDAISTNVTSFFRESEHFDYLRQFLSASQRAGQRSWRIWSAASSTGEEPYSIAMTACDVLGEDADVKILATDISTRVLASARAAVYPADKVKSIPAPFRDRWLQRDGKTASMYAVRKELKDKVVFRRLNLAKPPYPMRGPLDAVFCRNVMIYFDDAVRKPLLDNIVRLLRSGGYLAVGHAETLTGINDGLRCIKPSIYCKP